MPVKERTLNALLLGDLVGAPGCRAVFFHLNSLVKKTQADLVIVNGENSSNEGRGIGEEQFGQLCKAGVDVVTSGNHIWEHKEANNLLMRETRLLRPANYPSRLAGKGACFVEKCGYKIAVLNFQGRLQMPLTDDPFLLSLEMVKKIRKETPLIFVDFHAEDAGEKEAFGFHLDGLVSAVVGTHTHIQTADEKILPQGTAYISDLGMCGPIGSVIGSDPQMSRERALTMVPHRYTILDAPAEIRGVLVKVDPQTGMATSIERIVIPSK